MPSKDDESFSSLLGQIVKLTYTKSTHLYAAVTSLGSVTGLMYATWSVLGLYLVTKGVNLMILHHKFK